VVGICAYLGAGYLQGHLYSYWKGSRIGEEVCGGFGIECSHVSLPHICTN
jgi:hypothetical protein